MLQMVRKGPIGSPAPAQAGKSPRKQSASKGSKPHQQQQPQQQDGLVPVVCGNLYAQFDTAAFDVQLADGSRVSASAFEKLGGKEANRKWKNSLYVVKADGGRVTIGKWLEQEGFIKGPQQKPPREERKRKRQLEGEGEEEKEKEQPQPKKKKVRTEHVCVA
jgi:hypothetical protein